MSENKREVLEKIILESKYPYSMLVYKLVHSNLLKSTIKKIDNIDVPCNVNPNEITSANEQFLQLLDRFITYFNDSFYFLHTYTHLCIKLIIETNYKDMEKYLLSKHYLGDNDYIPFFNNSIYRMMVANFIRSINISSKLRKLFIQEKIAIKNINDYSLEEIFKINDLLENIVFANARDSFNTIYLFDDISKCIYNRVKQMKKKKLDKTKILSLEESLNLFYSMKIDSLIEEYFKKKKYIKYFK